MRALVNEERRGLAKIVGTVTISGSPLRRSLVALRTLPRTLTDPEVLLRGYLFVLKAVLYCLLLAELVLLAFVLKAVVR